MNIKQLLVATAFVAAASLGAGSASALTTYGGLDDGQSAPVGPNSAAAQAAFLAAAGSGLSLVTFENGTSGAIGTSGSGSITSSSPCSFALCGGNTTSGGRMFYSIYGNTATFTFGPGINAFGAYFSGVQVLQHMTFSDGSSQSVLIQNGGFSQGGMSFAGFIDAGKSITSISFDTGSGGYCTGCDIIAIDDVYFGNAGGAVPEPATWALMIAGFGMAGTALRRRRALAA